LLRKHISGLLKRAWTQDTALDLRRFLIERMEEHAERSSQPGLTEGL
jgi:hypothetical protein